MRRFSKIEPWNLVGRISFEDALEFILKKRTRFGRGVLTQSPESEALESKANQEILARQMDMLALQEKALAKSSSKAVSLKLLRLKHQRDILTAMAKFGERKIHVTELAAALVLAYGLDFQALQPHLNALRRLAYKTEPPFRGSLQLLKRVVHRDLITRVYDSLSPPGHYTTGIELEKKFGASTTDICFINGILDLAGLVHKLPTDSRMPSFVWMHAKYKPPEPTWNYAYLALKALANSQKALSAQEILKHEHTSTIPRYPHQQTGQLFSNVLRLAVSNLAASGLIAAEKAGKQVRYSAVPAAVKWVWRTQTTGVLHPALNQALLGHFNPTRPPVSELRERRLLCEINFHLLRQANKDMPLRRFLSSSNLLLSYGAAKNYEKGGTNFTSYGKKQLKRIVECWKSRGLKEQAEYVRRVHLTEAK